ncbi:MAG: hypothetical protein AAF411_26030 [Myxococcota bacterium]
MRVASSLLLLTLGCSGEATPARTASETPNQDPAAQEAPADAPVDDEPNVQLSAIEGRMRLRVQGEHSVRFRVRAGALAWFDRCDAAEDACIELAPGAEVFGARCSEGELRFETCPDEGTEPYRRVLAP